jgi:hypothetical protein
MVGQIPKCHEMPCGLDQQECHCGAILLNSCPGKVSVTYSWRIGGLLATSPVRHNSEESRVAEFLPPFEKMTEFFDSPRLDVTAQVPAQFWGYHLFV